MFLVIPALFNVIVIKLSPILKPFSVAGTSADINVSLTGNGFIHMTSFARAVLTDVCFAAYLSIVNSGFDAISTKLPIGRFLYPLSVNMYLNR